MSEWGFSCFLSRRGNRRHSESDRGDATCDSCRVDRLDGPSSGGGGEVSSDCTCTVPEVASQKVVSNDGCSSAVHGITRGCTSNFRRGDCAPDKLVVGSVRFAIIVVPRRSSQGGRWVWGDHHALSFRAGLALDWLACRAEMESQSQTLLCSPSEIRARIASAVLFRAQPDALHQGTRPHGSRGKFPLNTHSVLISKT